MEEYSIVLQNDSSLREQLFGGQIEKNEEEKTLFKNGGPFSFLFL